MLSVLNKDFPMFNLSRVFYLWSLSPHRSLTLNLVSKILFRHSR